MSGLVDLVADYGYPGLALLVLVEGFGIPLPGQTAVILAAGLAGSGKLNVVGVGLVAFLAAVIGDNIGFWIGRSGGRPLVLRFGRYVRLTEPRLRRVEDFMRRRGPVVVTIARFVDGMRQLSGIVAGATGMPWRRFVVFEALGAALWAGTWTAAGYLVGGHLAAIEAELRRYLWLVVVLAVLLVAGWLLLRRRRRAAAPEAGGPEAGGPEADGPEADGPHADGPKRAPGRPGTGTVSPSPGSDPRAPGPAPAGSATSAVTPARPVRRRRR